MSEVTARPVADEQQAPILPVSYRSSASKLLWCLAGCLGFVAIGYYLRSQPFANDSSPQTTLIIGWAALAFFGFSTVVIVLLLSLQPRLVSLREQGLLIGGHKRWIDWKDITDFRLVHQRVGGFFGAFPHDIVWIAIFIEDTSVYHSSWGPIGRWLASITERKFGTPILLNCDLLPVEPDTFIEWLNWYRARYSRQRDG